MATYREITYLGAERLVLDGAGTVQMQVNGEGNWIPINNRYYSMFCPTDKYRQLVEDEKIIRYDWHDKGSSVDVDRVLFETEEEALGNLHHSISDGDADGQEYIIYKITYEPVKRLRVKINTTLEEI